MEKQMASYSGLWNGYYNENYTQLTNRVGNGHTALARVFAQRRYTRGAIGALVKSLVAGNVGDATTLSHKRIAAISDVTSNGQGGARAIETFLDINRVSTVTDQTNIVNAIALSPQPSYPVDKSGNGGGSKRGV